MLCARCYKKISKGEEVAKAGGYGRVSAWGQWGGNVYCKRCAILQDKKVRIFFAFFFLVPFVMMKVILVFLVLNGTLPFRFLLYSIPGFFLVIGLIWFEFFSARKTKKKQ